VALALSRDPEAQLLLGPLRGVPGSTREALQSYLQRHTEAGRIVGDPATLVTFFVGGLMALSLMDSGLSEESGEAAARQAVTVFLQGVRPRDNREENSPSRRQK